MKIFIILGQFSYVLEFTKPIDVNLKEEVLFLLLIQDDVRLLLLCCARDLISENDNVEEFVKKSDVDG